MRNAIERFVCAVLLAASLAWPAEAGVDEGKAAFDRGDYATAYRELLPLAQTGDARAQVFLGYMYSQGQGVNQSYAEAMKWYRMAADRGSASAQNNLGLMFEKGQGVVQDYVQAHMWYNLAAASLPEGEFREKAALSRDELAYRMTPEQIAKAQDLARNFKPQ